MRTRIILLLLSFSITHSVLVAQSVPVGSGSYSTSLPSDAVGPQNSSNQPVSPKISAEFDQPVQSNDYWSSLIYPFFGDAHSNNLYAHPIVAKAVSGGLQIGYPNQHIFAANDYLYPFNPDLTVGIQNFSSSQATTDSYGDWTVTALWKTSDKQMHATLGHGLPYVFFRIEGGNAVITPSSSINIWHQEAEVLGITINGKHYGIFAPAGSEWSTGGSLTSNLNDGDYLSVALLPDGQSETLELFRNHAYAFVTDSRVAWEYDESGASVTSTYTYITELMEEGENNINETLTALYRHQFRYTDDPLTEYSYESPRGEMKLRVGNTFSTEVRYSGVLPALPDEGDYNRSELLAFVEEAAEGSLGVGPSYENGKYMARFANLIHIADQIGAVEERDYFLSQLKNRLEDWFTAGGSQEYSYNDEWDVLTGYPSGYGADNQINDHHFHSSYAIVSAATIARYDSEWASQEQWGAMVNLLIKDSNNWDRTETQFPFLRSHDAYAGHSWAAGHGDFAEGNNQESSSESMNFSSAVILWGEATGQDDIRDLGVFLYTTETTAVEEYWFDVHEEVFPQDYPHVAIGMVWGGKGVHATWFGADPEFIHGINLLPITSGSLYLGRHPDYISKNYDEVVSEQNGQPDIWQDILWQYLSMADADRALSYYFADNDYEPFDGESRAHTMHWLYNMKKMGHLDTTTFADTPTYAVFKDANEDKTYIAYNAGAEERTVTFTDGYTMSVAPRELKSMTTREENEDEPVVLLNADKTSGKAPLTVMFKGSRSFDRSDRAITHSWVFDTLGNSSAADTSFTFTEPGEYKVMLTVRNSDGFSSKDSLVIEVKGSGTPYLGEPHQMPGKIEAEHYDKGGEGVAYHDVDANNIGLGLRPDEGVDLEGANDGGFDVYWIVAGEWIEYTFEVEESGLYNITPYVASVPGFGNFHLYIDNEDVSGRINVTGTGGWQSWTPKLIKDVQIDAGVHRMRFEFDSDTDKEGWLFSLNYTLIEKSSTVNNEREINLPSEVSLQQNYPNPFNPTTTIRYSIPMRGEVSLRVMNAIGQVVATLENGMKSAGNYSTTFDAKGLPSGLYLYQLRTEQAVETGKMMLIK